MNGIYVNTEYTLQKRPFIFKKRGSLGRSVRLNVFTFQKVGSFDPLSYKGNTLITPGCLSGWLNED